MYGVLKLQEKIEKQRNVRDKLTGEGGESGAGRAAA
jgi:hypothetical protein